MEFFMAALTKAPTFLIMGPTAVAHTPTGFNTKDPAHNASESHVQTKVKRIKIKRVVWHSDLETEPLIP